MNLLKSSLIVVTAVSMLTACVGGQIKARKEQREKVSQTSKLYCDFVNGETYPDVEVALNLEIAKRCDSDKAITISGYHSPSDAIGMIYCCGIKDDLGKEKKEPKEPKDLKESKEPKKDKAMNDDNSFDKDKLGSKPAAPSTASTSPSVSSPSSPSGSSSPRANTSNPTNNTARTKPNPGDKSGPDKGSLDKLSSAESL